MTHPSRARGVALIAVLWLIALLTLLGTAAATLSASHRRAARMLERSAQIDELADSAIRVTLLRMIAPKSPNEHVPVGAAQTIALPAGVAEVEVERELSRLDLNTADDALVFAMFAANGWSDEQARQMADRIADWKDPDDEPRRGGAERREYADAGLHYAPRNGPFESVLELRQVLGAERITPDLLEACTVYTHTQTPPQTLASPLVMRALRLADTRQLDGHGWLAAQAAAGEEIVTLTGEVVRVRACARAGSFERCRSMTGRLTGSTHTPVQVFMWQEFSPLPVAERLDELGH
jgi:general secretion pathway protein K